MPIQIYDNNDEIQLALAEYNTGKRKRDQITPAVRNAETGWPMIQVSFFTPCEEELSQGKTVYEPVLGGGKCHSFDFAMFGFIELMARVPNSNDVTLISHPSKQYQAQQINWGIAGALLHGFKFVHKAHFIECSSTMGGYGLQTEIKTPPDEEAGSVLQEIFCEAIKNIFQPGKRIPLFDPGYKSDLKITEGMMWDAIDQDFVIIRNGQIFVDLGKLFDKKVSWKDNPEKRQEIKEYFSAIFQVEAFLKYAQEKNFSKTEVEVEALIESPTVQRDLEPHTEIDDGRTQVRSVERLKQELDVLRRKLASLPPEGKRAPGGLFNSSEITNKSAMSAINHIVMELGEVPNVVTDMDAKVIRNDTELRDILKKYSSARILSPKVVHATDSSRAMLRDTLNKALDSVPINFKK